MEQIAWTRWRWRMRGAWMWPAFIALTAADALIVHARPISGSGTAIVPALLLALFFNLVVVAVPAQMLGALLRRRRPDLPKGVAHNYVGTALLVAVTGGLLAGGALHAASVDAQQRSFRAQGDAVRRYVQAQAPAVYRRNIDRANTLRIDKSLYRTCVPGPDPQRALCLYVNTDQQPPGVRLDPDRETNADFSPRGAYAP